MSLKNKVLTGIFAVSAFAVAGMAQDTAPKTDTGKKTRPDGWVSDGVRKGERGDRSGRHGAAGFRGIELTDAQKEQIRKIREANRPDPAVREEMKTIMTAKRAGTATAAQEARLQALRAEGKSKAQSVHAQIEAILTPEQKAQIEQRKQEMKARREEMRQRMQERRQQRRTDKPTTTTTTTPETKKDN